MAQWNEQSNLRSWLTTLPAFKHKKLPQLSSHHAWDLALGGFQSSRESVTLSAELVLNSGSSGPLFSLKLSPLKVERSHRLGRRFGADRFLEVLMPYPASVQESQMIKESRISSDDIVRWLTGKKHYFLGRRWTAFYCKPADKKKSARKEESRHRQRVFLFASEGDNFQPCLCGQLPPATEATNLKTRTTVKNGEMIQWAIGSFESTEQQVLKLFSRISLSMDGT
jgi:hypothetical protein